MDVKLHNAIRINDLNLINDLLQNGMQLNYKKSSELTPLDYAVINRNIFLVKYFIEKGSDIHAHGNYALLKAVILNDLAIVKILMVNGANENDNFNTTYGSAIELAFKMNNTEIIKYFIKNKILLIFLLDFHYKRKLELNQSSIADCNLITLVFSFSY